MNAHVPRAAAVDWPPPPFFKLAEPQTGQGRQCVLELIDGSVLRAELVEFERGVDSVALRSAQSPGIQRIAFTRIRSIRLPQPVAYVVDTEASDVGGAINPAVTSHRPFVIQLADGTKMTGRTLGFVKEDLGLFLFLVEDDAAHVVNCFLPASHIRDVQIGPLLADTAASKGGISADALALALNTQARHRQDRAANYVSNRVITSTADLLFALDAQKIRPQVRLGEILIEEELITPKELEDALTFQATHPGRRIGEILVEMGAVSTRLIQFAMSDKLGIPYVNVREFKIGPGALEAIDTAFAIHRQALPLLRTDNSLIVAVEDPVAIEFAQELRLKAGMTVALVIASPQDLKVRIAKEYSILEGSSAASRPGLGVKGGAEIGNANANSNLNIPQTKVGDLTSQLARETQQTTRASKDGAIDPRVSQNTLVKLVNRIIIEAHAQGASDIHIESNAGAVTRIRFRKDGDLEDYLELPQAYSNAVVSRIKVMAELDISEHRHPQDGKIDFGRHGPLSIELRVAIIPTANGLQDVVLRILGGVEPVPLEEVGFSVTDLQKLRKMIARSYGLMLVCGPTGSGKTTTLHSILREINRPDVKIWTAEDPIEITQAGLRQVQVHAKIDWTFAAAMRAFLRADPDVIMVGEMRDAETTKIGIEASLTGHLVFSTLHTNSAAESVVRLLDLGMDPFNFADALIGILSQRLARKLCSNCKEAYVASAAEVTALSVEYCSETNLDPAAVSSRWRSEFGKEGHLVLRRASGCDSCRDGHKGRVVVYELLAGTPQIKELVRTHGSVPQLLAAAQQDGMLSLRQSAIEKVLHGVLDLAGARAVSS